MAPLLNSSFFFEKVISYDIFLRSGLACANDRMKACRNKMCISSTYFCDGVNNCGDWSDEMDCQETVNYFLLKLNVGIYIIKSRRHFSSLEGF